jgi:hypothetical protein
MVSRTTLDGAVHEIPPLKITPLDPPLSKTTKTEGVAEIAAFIDAKRNAAEMRERSVTGTLEVRQ